MTREVEIRLHEGDVCRLVAVRDKGRVRVLVFDDDVDVPLVQATRSGPELDRLLDALG